MHDKVTITPMDGYIYVEVFAKGSSEELLTMWRDIATTCTKHQCFNVLGVTRIKSGVDILTGFDHHAVFLETGIDHRYRLAWVGETQRIYESIEFIKNVLANRTTIYGKIFSNEDDAKKWLKDKARK